MLQIEEGEVGVGQTTIDTMQKYNNGIKEEKHIRKGGSYQSIKNIIGCTDNIVLKQNTITIVTT